MNRKTLAHEKDMTSLVNRFCTLFKSCNNEIATIKKTEVLQKILDQLDNLQDDAIVIKLNAGIDAGFLTLKAVADFTFALALSEPSKCELRWAAMTFQLKLQEVLYGGSSTNIYYARHAYLMTFNEGDEVGIQLLKMAYSAQPALEQECQNQDLSVLKESELTRFLFWLEKYDNTSKNAKTPLPSPTK